MKTKIIAATMALSAAFCTVVMAQGDLRGNSGNSSGNSTNTATSNTGNNNTTHSASRPQQPQLDLNGKLFTENNLMYVYNEVSKTKAYKDFKNKVNAKINASKPVSGFTRFLQKIGLAKKSAPAKKATPPKKSVPAKKASK